MHKGSSKIMRLVWLMVAVLVVIIDQISKYFALKYLIFEEPYSVTPFFDFWLTLNRGAAFGFLHTASGWQLFFFSGLAFLVSAWILRALLWLPLTERASYYFGLSLIMGGALANVYDRVYYHAVVDFLHFHWDSWHFAIFNLADSAITLGAALLIWNGFREWKCGR